MMKKIFSVLICILLAVSAFTFSVYAESKADFKVCIYSQDDKSVTVTLDFTGGTGFNALDVSIKYDTLKLGFESCQFSSGFASFSKKCQDSGSMPMYVINDKDNPIKASVISLTPFEKTGNDGSVLKLKFSKINGTTVKESDIKFTIDNCATNDGEISAKLTYDLTDGSSSSATDSAAPEITLDENGDVVEAKTDDNSGSEAEKPEENTSAADGNNSTPVSENGEAKSVNAEEEQLSQENDKPGSKISNTKKTIIIIVCAAVLLLCVGITVLFIVKNKKDRIDETDK